MLLMMKPLGCLAGGGDGDQDGERRNCARRAAGGTTPHEKEVSSLESAAKWRVALGGELGRADR